MTSTARQADGDGILELASNCFLEPPRLNDRQPAALGTIFWHNENDFMAPVASGSSLTDGMVICPSVSVERSSFHRRTKPC